MVRTDRRMLRHHLGLGLRKSDPRQPRWRKKIAPNLSPGLRNTSSSSKNEMTSLNMRIPCLRGIADPALEPASLYWRLEHTEAAAEPWSFS